jgi:translation elongation factor P/translation initiation factor 5A
MGMGVDGRHYFGVVTGQSVRSASGSDEQVIHAVPAVSYAQYLDDDGGAWMVLTDEAGEIVERYAPGTSQDVTDTVPGVDDEAPE